MSEPIMACRAFGRSGVGPGVRRRCLRICIASRLGSIRIAFGMPLLERRIAFGMPLLERLQTEMVAAMKAKEEARLGALRMIKAALKKHEIDSMKPLDEPTEMQILGTLIKQRRESIEMFRKGGREDLAQKEEVELKLIESYMPASASE